VPTNHDERALHPAVIYGTLSVGSYPTKAASEPPDWPPRTPPDSLLVCLTDAILPTPALTHTPAQFK